MGIRDTLGEPSGKFDYLVWYTHQWAYSKFIIRKIITSNEWGDSLFKQRELKYGKPHWYSYFDYIQAWTGALLYENRQRKFSWFIQFQLEKEIKEFPP